MLEMHACAFSLESKLSVNYNQQIRNDIRRKEIIFNLLNIIY
jgi:hypothetical protein